MAGRRLIGLSLLTCLLVAARAQGESPPIVLADGGRSDYRIVLQAGASDTLRHAADELSQDLRRRTGVELPVAVGKPEMFALSADADSRDAGLVIILYRTGSSENGGVRSIDESFHLHTAGPTVWITSPSDRGVLYGTLELLERLGVQWLAPDVTELLHSSRIELAPLDVRDRPAFSYRDVLITEANQDPTWTEHLRLNGFFAGTNKPVGGHVSYQPFVHSLDLLIPQELFASHPEYFPLIDGKRTPGYVQRCLSNPEVLKLAIAQTRKWIKEHPEARYISVSQNDTAYWCQCDKCRAIEAKFGSHSGLWVWFVNQIADDIARDFPDRWIDTLAYQFTEAPPTGIAPRANVSVRLCPIAVCESHPYGTCDDDASKQFVERLRAWAKLAPNLAIWHYNCDFHHYLMPFPDFAQVPASMRLYRDSHVQGVFCEGAYGKGGGADAELRAWLLSKLMWNPDADASMLIDHWMKGVYGPAAVPMKEWFDAIQKQAADPANHLHVFQEPTAGLFPADLRQHGHELLDRARTLAVGNTSAERRINRAMLCLRYIDLVLDHGNLAAAAKLSADAQAAGIKDVAEGESFDSWLKQRKKN